MAHRLISLAAALLFCQCAGSPDTSIPGPSATVKRSDAMSTAYTYSRLEWVPQERHRKHGRDSNGILVHTPDVSLSKHGFSNGWWQPGSVARGMAYQWGGFDTPENYLKSLERGEVAGDISTTEKRRLGDAGTSKDACGIDCSGFVSRCWRLARPYSTKELPSICVALASWDKLRPGDILLNDRHVVLFSRWSKSGASLYVYEAGPLPVWRVNAAEISKASLLDRGYRPWRYRGIRD